MELTVKENSRKWGVGYSFTPTGEDAYSIETPGIDYTGTLKQCRKQLSEDRTFTVHSQTAFHNVAWFYDDRRIIATRYGWIDDHDNFQPGFVKGFVQDAIMDGVVTIQTE